MYCNVVVHIDVNIEASTRVNESNELNRKFILVVIDSCVMRIFEEVS